MKLNLTRKNEFKLSGLFSIAALSLTVLLARHLPASFQDHAVSYYANIDGTSFGLVHHVDGLDTELKDGNDYYLIQLERKFVTEPSLYHWAKRTSQQQTDVDDIEIVITDDRGEPLKTVKLAKCQPLSWTIEADDTASGGFYEKISIAVQSIVEL